MIIYMCKCTIQVGADLCVFLYVVSVMTVGRTFSRTLRRAAMFSPSGGAEVLASPCSLGVTAAPPGILVTYLLWGTDSISYRRGQVDL
jgi:hypothetical protein